MLNVESAGLSPKQFFRLCRDNPDLRIELTAQKEIIMLRLRWEALTPQQTASPCFSQVSDESCAEHVAAGFMPAFKFPKKACLFLERGHKARGYVQRGRWFVIVKPVRNAG